METVAIGGLKVAYERVGEGPPIVLLHGALADSRVWRRQIAELSDEFAVVAWDAPGAGRSSDPTEPFGMAEWADSLAALMDGLSLRPAHVLGQSWGGVLAQELYRRHPALVRSLILADTYAGWKGSLPERLCAERLESVLHEIALPPSELVTRWLPGLLTEGAPPEAVDELVSIMSGFHPEGSRLMAHAIATADTRDLLPHVHVPTLLLWGSVDVRSPLSVAEEMGSAIPDARLVVIPGAGHDSNIEQPDAFNVAVREFCRSLPA